MRISLLTDFQRQPFAGGVLLMASAIAALVIANSPLAWLYDLLLSLPLKIRLGDFEIAKPLLLWINDGLMAVFFLLVGLEIKRELLDGTLSRLAQATLPAIAALGGMAAPAAIYAFLNRHDPAALHGWAIPAATDIAFALGVLSLLDKRVPLSLKVFLATVAIFDDLGTIVIIALFHTAKLSIFALLFAAVALLIMLAMNSAGVMRLAPYILVGIVLWVCVLKSGVHATLAGVAVASAIPLRGRDKEGRVPLDHLEHILDPWVAFMTLPLFAFANAGVSFAGLSPGIALDSVALGIAAGLFIGKQIGVFGTVWVAAKFGVDLPADATWAQIYGVSLLAGIGFTMSLFIGTLAFDDMTRAASVRLGVLAGSLLAGICGYAVLRVGRPAPSLSEMRIAT